MSYTTVLAQVKSVLEGVSGVANVYDYPRLQADITTLDSRYTEGSTFHFWFIDRESTRTVGFVGSDIQRVHVWKLWYYRAVVDADATAKTAQQLVDDVLNEFQSRANRGLSATADIVTPPELLRMVHGVAYPREGGPLCHVAEIQLETTEVISCP